MLFPLTIFLPWYNFKSDKIFYQIFTSPTSNWINGDLIVSASCQSRPAWGPAQNKRYFQLRTLAARIKCISGKLSRKSGMHGVATQLSKKVCSFLRGEGGSGSRLYSIIKAPIANTYYTKINRLPIKESKARHG
jgi:hypothetical protein